MNGLKDRYFTTGQHTLCYQYIQGKGLPLVFLHGGTGSLSVWYLSLSELKKSKRPILLIDLFGHGKSSISDDWHDYSLENHAQYILNLVAELKITKFDLIGHCLGSMIASVIASKQPSLVRKLVLINPGGFNKSIYLSSFTVGIVRLLLPLIHLITDRIPRKKGRPDERKYIGNHELYIPRFLDEVRYCSYKTAVNQFIAFSKWNEAKYYPNIKAPTLVISGVKDIIFSPKTTHKVVGLIPKLNHVQLPTNHLAPLNMSSEMTELINVFTNNE